MPLLEVKNLSLGFTIDNKFYKVLKNITFEVNKSEIFSIVGESGCGKSLTSLAILNLLPLNAKILSGSINLNNFNLLKTTEKQMQAIRGNEIFLIPQDPMTSLNPLYRIEDQMLEVIKLKYKGISKEESYNKIIRTLKDVHIQNPEERLNSYPHELSGGMKQRIIIAMALLAKSSLIIADEPTTALDVTVQAQIMQLLREIKNKYNTSIILITHDLGIVSENADKVAVMYYGEIVELANTKTLFNNPKHPYTKALINSLPDFNSKVLHTIKGQVPSIYESIKGCPFSSRCNFCFAKCKKTAPELKKLNDESYVSCFLY